MTIWYITLYSVGGSQKMVIFAFL